LNRKRPAARFVETVTLLSVLGWGATSRLQRGCHYLTVTREKTFAPVMVNHVSNAEFVRFQLQNAQAETKSVKRAKGWRSPPPRRVSASLARLESSRLPPEWP